MLSAILYISKVALEFVPNVELVTMLTIIYALVFGAETYLVVTVFNMFELVQWPLLCLITLLLKRLIKEEFLVWAVVSGGFGLIFGALFAVFYLPMDPHYALSYWISGLPWDVAHSISNFIVMLILGKPLYRLLRRLKAMFE